MYTHIKRSHMHFKAPVVHVSSLDYRNTQITQHELKVSESSVLKPLDTIPTKEGGRELANSAGTE